MPALADALNELSTLPSGSSAPDAAAAARRDPNDRGVIARWAQYLPVTEKTPFISLNEGSTPLIYSPKLSDKVGPRARVFIKYEGLNPTGSFKDRGMCMAISKAAEAGAKAVICASTGNTSASAAAYAARAGLTCAVLLPQGKIAKGKLAQAIVHGAKVIAIDGNFDDALRLVREIGATGRVAIVNSINPDRIEGQKTASFEIIEELGDAPHVHILPVGNAGNITAYWKGYREFRELGKATRLPRMAGFQASGSAPIFHGKVVENPETLATAIRIGNPASWDYAKAAIAESKGAIDIVTDDEILEAQAWLAREEGIFVEPASAASVAGLLKGLAGRTEQPSPAAQLPEGEGLFDIVCTVTGHGLKDTETALLKSPEPEFAPAETGAILRLLGLE